MSSIPTTDEIQAAMAAWPKAFSPRNHCRFRGSPADFKVDEQLSFEPSGEGQHAYLRIRKTNLNTAWVARQLAKLANTQSRNVGYAGLKDRHAVTSQWFSIDLRGKPAPDWSLIQQYCREGEALEVLTATYGERKLKHGAVKANHFEIVLRDCTDMDDLQRCVGLAQAGIPNYFGEQRFGNDGNNIVEALNWFAGAASKAPKDMLISAARSYIFNQQLAHLIGAGAWNKRGSHQYFSLRDSKSVFAAENEPDLEARLALGEIHPAITLSTGGVTEHDSATDKLSSALAIGLSQHRLHEEFRPTRVTPQNLRCVVKDASSVQLSFSLRSGAYATSVLNELNERYKI